LGKKGRDEDTIANREEKKKTRVWNTSKMDRDDEDHFNKKAGF